MAIEKPEECARRIQSELAWDSDANVIRIIRARDKAVALEVLDAVDEIYDRQDFSSERFERALTKYRKKWGSDDHTKTGNCWLVVYACEECGVDNFCDVCHDHDEPRGGCSECPACCARLEVDLQKANNELRSKLEAAERQLVTERATITAFSAKLEAAETECDELRAKVKTAEAERDEARDWVRRMHNERQVLTCAFCGEAYPPGTQAANDTALAEHIRVCSKHPMREVERGRDEAKGRCERTAEALAKADREVEAILARERSHIEAAAAYVQDRAEQYANSSGYRAAIEVIAAALAAGEHLEAFKHGELDDIIKRPSVRAIRQKLSSGDSQTPGTRGSGPAGPTTGSDEGFSDGMPSSSRLSGDDAASGSESRLTPAPLTLDEHSHRDAGLSEESVFTALEQGRREAAAARSPGGGFVPPGAGSYSRPEYVTRQAYDRHSRELSKLWCIVDSLERALGLPDKDDDGEALGAAVRELLQRVAELERAKS